METRLSRLYSAVPSNAVLETDFVERPRLLGTILVVDDDLLLRDLTCRVLETYGYPVISAQDAPEAIRAFDQHKGEIQLVVTDLRMPGMNGRELVQQLAARSDGLKAIFVSGYPSELIGQIDSSLEYGFLQKPFTLESLVRKVREMMDGTTYPAETTRIH